MIKPQTESVLNFILGYLHTHVITDKHIIILSTSSKSGIKEINLHFLNNILNQTYHHLDLVGDEYLWRPVLMMMSQMQAFTVGI